MENIISNLKKYANELQELLNQGWTLGAISRHTYQMREKAADIPYMAIGDTVRVFQNRREVVGIYAHPTSNQPKLKAFFAQKAPNSVLGKYVFRITKDEGLVFTERLGKGEGNVIDLLVPTTRKTTPEEKEVMEYLNELRDSGKTNMFGATPYIQEKFQFTSRESREILVLWMENFSEEGNYESVKIKN